MPVTSAAADAPAVTQKSASRRGPRTVSADDGGDRLDGVSQRALADADIVPGGVVRIEPVRLLEQGQRLPGPSLLERARTRRERRATLLSRGGVAARLRLVGSPPSAGQRGA